MLVAAEKIQFDGSGPRGDEASISLPFETRQKTRLQATLDSGKEIGLLLPRGTILRHGDYLKTENDLIIRVEAAQESVSTAYIDDKQLFARACYHLGNRHVPLQVGDCWLRYLHDHVLDDMLVGLGIQPIHEVAPFEPEAGAYAGGHHHHHHHQ